MMEGMDLLTIKRIVQTSHTWNYSFPVSDLYHNYEEVVQLILEVFAIVVKKQLCYLGSEDSQKVYKLSLSMIEMYAKHNIGE